MIQIFKSKVYFILLLNLTLYSSLSLGQDIPNHLDIIILIDVSGSMQFSLDGCNQQPGYPDPITGATVSGVPPNPNDPTCTACAVCSGGAHPNPSWQRLHYVKEGLNALTYIFTRLQDTGDGGVQSIRFAFGKFPGGSSATPTEFSWLPISGTSTMRTYSASELSSLISGLDITWFGTPIGTALYNPNYTINGKPRGAIQKFSDPPNPQTTNLGKMIWLFTDGKQHGGEPIYSGSSSSGSGHANVLFKGMIDHMSAMDLPNDRIKIVSVGFGDNSDVSGETDFAMLNDISKQFGKYDPLMQSMELADDFTKTTINTGFSSCWNKQVTLTDPTHFINPVTVVEHVEYVTEYDQKMLFLISWNKPRTKNALNFSLRSATGVIIDSSFASQNSDLEYDSGKVFKMYTVHKAFLENNIGEWKLVVDASGMEKPEYYSYSILGFSDLQLLDKTDQKEIPHFTGATFKLKVAVQAKDAHVSNANVTARIIGPEEGAGNWFASHTLTPAQFDSVLNIGFPGHVENFYKKYYYLNILNRIPLPKIVSSEITFTYNPEDGLYYAQGPVIQRPGIYEVEIIAKREAGSEEFSFRRDLKRSYYIDIKPNLNWTISKLDFRKIVLGRFKLTEISLIKLKSEGIPTDIITKLNPILNQEYTHKNNFLKTLNLTIGHEQTSRYGLLILKHVVNLGNISKTDTYEAKFTPIDQSYQNFLKPGREENIRFNVKNATLSQSIVDSLAGSYYQRIEVPRNSLRPSLQIQYNDFVFEERDITDNPTGDNWRIHPNSVIIHAGAVVPIDSTANSYDPYFDISVGLMRRLVRNWAIIVSAAYSQLKGKGAIQDAEYFSVSANIRWYPIITSRYRIYLNGGGGYYISDPGSNDIGYKIGLGGNIPLSPHFDLEIGGDFNNILRSSQDIRFVQIHGGFLIRF